MSPVIKYTILDAHRKLYPILGQTHNYYLIQEANTKLIFNTGENTILVFHLGDKYEAYHTMYDTLVYYLVHVKLLVHHLLYVDVFVNHLQHEQKKIAKLASMSNYVILTQ